MQTEPIRKALPKGLTLGSRRGLRLDFRIGVMVALPVILSIGMGWLIGHDISLLVAVAASVLFCCVLFVLRQPFASLGILLIPLTALDSYLVLVRYRVTMAGLPIGMIDLGLGLTAMSLVIALLRSRFSRAELSLQMPVAMWVLLSVTLVSTLWGFSNGNHVYEIIRDLRPIVSFVLIYLISINTVRQVPQVEILFKVFIAGTSLAAVQQVYRFAQSTPIYLARGSISFLRLAAFQAPFYAVALLMLLGFLVHIERTSEQGGLRFLAIILTILNLGALLVTLNRGPWIFTTVSLIFGIILVRRLHRPALLRWFGGIILGTGVALLVWDLLLPSSLDPLDLLSSRAQSILGDPTVRGESYYTRLAGWRLDLTAWKHGSLLLGRGLGFRDYGPYLGVHSEAVGVGHNSYLFYLVRMGPVGVLAVLWILVSFLRRSWNLYIDSHSWAVQLVSWNSLLTIIYLSMNAMTSAPFHNERVMPVLGLFFGLATVCDKRLQERNSDASSRQQCPYSAFEEMPTDE